MKIFWSYANKDDKKPHNLSSLREAFNISVDQTLGVDCDIIVDVNKLNWGDVWLEKLETLVTSSDYFLPILTPSYFQSKMCMNELRWAIESEKKIIPILYRKCPKGFYCNFTESDINNIKLNNNSKLVSNYQYHDFTTLRNKPCDSELVLNFLDKISEQIA